MAALVVTIIKEMALSVSAIHVMVKTIAMIEVLVVAAWLVNP